MYGHACALTSTQLLAWMTDMESIEWWLALPEEMISMNRQVHSTTTKSPYEIIFKQLMPDRPRISTQRSTAVAIKKHHDTHGLPLRFTHTLLDSTTESLSIDPQLLATMSDIGDTLNQQSSVTEQAAAVPEATQAENLQRSRADGKRADERVDESAEEKVDEGRGEGRREGRDIIKPTRLRCLKMVIMYA